MNITIYNESYFSSIQKKIKFSMIDENLIKKIKNLTTNYSCFKHIPKKNNNYHKRRYYNNTQRYVKKTDDKIILSQLNKITSDNYNLLKNKIIYNINNDNYKLVIDKLIDISIKQSNYIDIYLSLYKELICDIKRKEYITERIISIFDNYDFHLLLNNDDISKLEYDDFCDTNKKKKKLKGLILLVLNLIKNNLIDITIEIFNTIIMKYKDYSNDTFLDILQIINYVKFLEDNIKEELNNYINNTNFKNNMKLKFKIKDIIENKPIKSF